MCRFSDAELNCVSTKMRRMPACRHPLIGTSIRRYLPPIGTAGFDRVAVSGNSREPWPPPRMIASVSLVTTGTWSAKPRPLERRGRKARHVQFEVAVRFDELQLERTAREFADRAGRPPPVDDDEPDVRTLDKLGSGLDQRPPSRRVQLAAFAEPEECV